MVELEICLLIHLFIRSTRITGQHDQKAQAISLTDII